MNDVLTVKRREEGKKIKDSCGFHFITIPTTPTTVKQNVWWRRRVWHGSLSKQQCTADFPLVTVKRIPFGPVPVDHYFQFFLLLQLSNSCTTGTFLQLTVLTFENTVTHAFVPDTKRCPSNVFFFHEHHTSKQLS